MMMDRFSSFDDRLQSLDDRLSRLEAANSGDLSISDSNQSSLEERT
jgi:hypothetical protein